MGSKELVRLDKADRVILAELDRDCRVPIKRLARMARKSRQAVEYRIARLVDEGVITGFHVSINPHRMGYKLYKIYLQLRNVPAERKKLLDYLRTSGIVYWMGECDGVWDLIFAVFTRSDYDFYALKNDLISRFGRIIVKREWGMLVDVKQYPKMYFTGKLVQPTEFAGEVVRSEMDELDYAILREIVNDARMPITALAGRVKATPMTVAARLKKMEREGVIIQYRIGVDLGKLGLEYYKTIIHVDRYTEEDARKLLAHVSSLPQIQYFIRDIWNLEPELVVRNYQEYGEIMDRMRAEFPQVIRNVESVLMRTDEWTPGFRNMMKQSR
ncbi:MAG: winged helix-turn-helix transcriptional regulator [Candidatus Burarchaeum sp.]|nr:winged helix-turn-helix transcriptional regulator [Candidatus Burarchaeum sp.]MDO8340026.1 winged helix-turn-helix transcriptional regulator [Candidatus Burarchaeum sp.]